MNSTLTCPHCNKPINLESTIAHQIEHRLSQEYAKKLASQNAALTQKESELQQREIQLKNQAAKQQHDMQQMLDARLQQLRPTLLKQVRDEQAVQVQALKEEVEQKSGLIKNLQQQELQLRRQQRELQEQKESIDLEVEKRLQKERNLLQSAALQKAREEQELKFEQQQLLIGSLTEQLNTMKRKLEQGSQQAQGEVQEVVLEKLLRDAFPFDYIEEITKGQNGADLIHEVRNEYGKVCGRIVLESKRTKSFNPAWINKLKADQQAHRGDLAVLVTETMPKEMDHAGLYDGIWVCTLQEVKILALALREAILRTAEVKKTESNKEDKKHLLYNYLTSQEFRHCLDSIICAFTGMKENLEREKKAFKKLWIEREKQIESVVDNTICLIGSIQGIAGREVADFPQLELSPEEDTLFIN